MDLLTNLDLGIFALLCLVYFAAGFIDSIAGGGGLISLPALLLTGLPPENVIATNKTACAFGTAVSLFNYSRNKLVVWRLALTGLPFAILGGVLGSEALLTFSSESIGKIIVLLLPVGVIATLIPQKNTNQIYVSTPWHLYLLSPVICLTIGFYEGFFGPGTGSFFILAFHIAMGMGLVQASATAKVFNLAASTSAIVVFAFNGTILFFMVLPFAICNILGNLLGSNSAIRLGQSLVRKVLLVSLSILFATLVWRILKN